MNEIKLYFRYLRIHLLSALEYKGWWLLPIQVMLVTVTDPLGTVLMFQRFGSIGSWSMERILLIYALAITSYGLAESLLRGFDTFPYRMLRSGDFDRLLLRPRSLFMQTAISVFNLQRLARPVSGIGMILWSLARMGVSLSPLNILILLSALLGGVVTYAGVFVLVSGISVFTIGSIEWIIVFTNASYQVTRIPFEFIPLIIRRFFTFGLPMLVFSYYPASAICGWGESTWTAFLSVPAGIAFFALSTLVWRFGLRHYRSTGS